MPLIFALKPKSEKIMKRLLFLMLSFAWISVEATHFQSSMSVTPASNRNGFLIEMQIEKIGDGCSTSELIASPKIVCIPGEPAQFTIGSEDQSDFLSIQVMISKNVSAVDVEASVLMKKDNQVVLSLNNNIKVNN